MECCSIHTVKRPDQVLYREQTPGAYAVKDDGMSGLLRSHILQPPLQPTAQMRYNEPSNSRHMKVVRERQVSPLKKHLTFSLHFSTKALNHDHKLQSIFAATDPRRSLDAGKEVAFLCATSGYHKNIKKGTTSFSPARSISGAAHGSILFTNRPIQASPPSSSPSSGSNGSGYCSRRSLMTFYEGIRQC